MDKSYVTMLTKTCGICQKEYPTDELVIDNHLREKFEMYTNVGYGVCPDCKKEGYVFLLVSRNPKEVTKKGMKGVEMTLTGDGCWISDVFWKRIFGTPAPENSFSFCSEGVFLYLKGLLRNN